MANAKTPGGERQPRREFLSGAAVMAAATVGGAHRRQGPGPDQHALAEHLAGQGHLPRVRPGLRQEGQRDDRRRSRHRGAACGRGRAGLRAARRRVARHARRWSRRARLSLRQAAGPGAVGVRAGVRHGREHAAGLAQIWWRQGPAAEALCLDRRRSGLLSLRPDADAATRLVQEAGRQCRRLQGPQVPHRRHLDRRVHRAWVPP